MTKATRLPITGDGITATPIKDMDKAAWLKEREKSIGGSEIGAIIGTSPWASAYSVYCERKGLFPPFEGNLATETGTYLEEFVAKKFSEISGLTVNRSNYLWRNENHPHLHASPDRLIIEKKKAVAGLECKTTSSYNTSKVRGVDFPLMYYAQCVQYMMVTGLPVWWLAVLVGNSEFHIYGLTRLAEMSKPEWCEGLLFVPQAEMDALQLAANEFWEQLESNTPPPPDGSDGTDKAIKQQFDEAVPGNADLWGMEKVVSQYMAAKKEADRADKEVKRLQQAIQLMMGGHEQGECLGYKVKWKFQPGRVSFDYKACIDANPDMAIYATTGKPFRKFEVKEV